MPRWEYRTALLEAVSNWSTNKKWQLREINEREQLNWKNTRIYASVAEFCNHMSQQGWELVGAVYPILCRPKVVLYFKQSLQRVETDAAKE